MKAKPIVVLLTCLVFLLTLAPGAVRAAEEVKLGVLAPFKTSIGESLIKATQMAADDINAKGGILGKKVTLVFANTEYKPQKGATAYKKLVLQDKCVAVFGCGSSGVSAAVMDQMARYKTIFMCGTASEALSDKYAKDKKKFKYWFRAMHESWNLSDTIQKFILDLPVKKMGAKRMAIMAENALWTRGMVTSAEKFFKDNNLEVVYNEFVDTETKDFTPVFTKIMNAKADFIYEISAHVDGAIYIKQWYDLKGPQIGGVSGAAASDRYWKDCGGKAEGETLVALGGQRVALTPKSIPFYDAYVKEFKESPGYPSGYVYDAMQVFKLAAEKAKSFDSAKLVPALEKTDYVGVVGRWVYTDQHNLKFGPGYRQMPMMQWRKDGSRKVVWPADMATGPYLLPPWLKK